MKLINPLRWLAMMGLSLGPAGAATEHFDLGGGTGLELVLVPKGQFTMGSPESEAGRNADEQAHGVTLTRDFYLGRTVVTKAQWQRFAAESGYRSEAQLGTSGGFGWNGTALEQRRDFTWQNPGYSQTPDHPVVIVTWDDAQQFLKWLSRKTGWTFELPSEAQWEYACRAGTTTAWWPAADAATAGRSIWSKETSQNQAHPVTALPANPLGLHIAGNVWEWCADWYGPYDLLAATDPLQRSAPPTDKARRVLRGGSWLRPLKDSRSAARYRNDARSRNADNGFRVLSYGRPPAAVQANPPVERADPPPPGARPPADSPQPAPSPFSPPASSHSVSSKSGFPWLLMLLGGGFLVWLIRRMLRQPTPPVPGGGVNPAAPPRLPQGQAFTLTPGTILTKPAPDGFWLNAGYAAGTWLDLSWREGGQTRQRRVQYDPGSEGQFIYTGAAPGDVQVTPGGASGIPPMPLTRGPGQPRHDDGRPDQHYRPSAY